MLILLILLTARVLTFLSLSLLTVVVLSFLMPREMFGPVVKLYKTYRPRIRQMFEEIKAEQVEEDREKKHNAIRIQRRWGRGGIPLWLFGLQPLKFLWGVLVVVPLEWVNLRLMQLVEWEEEELEAYDRFFGIR